MPYKNNSDLPVKVKQHLPPHAQDIYREAFNHAWEQYKSPNKRRDPTESQEKISHKIAWTAVERKYKKNMENKWVLI